MWHRIMSIFLSALAVTTAMPWTRLTGGPETERWALETAQGRLLGTLSPGKRQWNATVAIEEDTAFLTFGGKSDGTFSVLVRYANSDRVHVWFDRHGVAIVDSTVRDCSSLLSGGLQQAVAAADLAEVSDRVALTMRLLQRVPSLAGCEHAYADPDYGVCVVHVTWQDCVECCLRDDRMDSLAAIALSLSASYLLKSAYVGAAVGFAISLDGCVSLTCEGKPGDPSPIYCNGGQGVCSNACAGAPGAPASECPAGQLCCPSDKNCASPWDPLCGVCSYEPENYCCKHPDDPGCGGV